MTRRPERRWAIMKVTEEEKNQIEAQRLQAESRKLKGLACGGEHLYITGRDTCLICGHEY